VSVPDRPAYALGLTDPKSGKLEFLCRGIWPGNLMRTDDPFYAWTWPSIDELRIWADALPDSAKSQIAERRLLIVPLTIAVGLATQTLKIRYAHPPPGESPAPKEPKRKEKATAGKPSMF
jgi:hypothetical protein